MNHRDTETTERDPITALVIGAAIEVHRVLGPGLLESAYEECLCHELSLRSIAFQRQLVLPVDYKGVRLDCGYRLDIVLPGKLIIEVKAVEALAGIRTGLLLNFNVPLLRDGIRRLVL